MARVRSFAGDGPQDERVRWSIASSWGSGQAKPGAENLDRHFMGASRRVNFPTEQLPLQAHVAFHVRRQGEAQHIQAALEVAPLRQAPKRTHGRQRMFEPKLPRTR